MAELRQLQAQLVLAMIEAGSPSGLSRLRAQATAEQVLVLTKYVSYPPLKAGGLEPTS